MDKKFIDWKTDTVYGFEEGKNALLVNAIREGIRKGDEFSPIKLIRFNNNEYCLMVPYNGEEDKGGHHRAIGHYYEQKPFPCIIEKVEYIPSSLKAFLLRIQRIELFDHRKIPHPEIRKYYTEVFNTKKHKYPRLESIF